MSAKSRRTKSDMAGAAKNNKTSIEIPLLASNCRKQKKKPIITLPEMTGSPKTEKSKQKKKIHNTEDLNILFNDTRDSDIAVKTKPKKTKKARLPSFLPSIDVTDESKKFANIKAGGSLDNKENDTESTDGEEIVRKRRGRTRKIKKKLSQDKMIDVTDESTKFANIKAGGSLDNKENDTESTDGEEIVRKRRGRTRKIKKKLSQDKMIDVTDESKKFANIKAGGSLDNKENDTESTDGEEIVRKRRGRTRKIKKKLSQDKMIDVTDESKKFANIKAGGSLDNKENDTESTDGEEIVRKRRGRTRKIKKKLSQDKMVFLDYDNDDATTTSSDITPSRKISDEDPIKKRKSSFEVSFNAKKKPKQILDRSEDKLVLSAKNSPEATSTFCVDTEAARIPTPKRSLLKKSIKKSTRKTKRETFEIAEEFYNVYCSIGTLKKPYQAKPTVSLISEVTPNATLESEPQRDIFDMVSRTPTEILDKMMIGSGESLIMGQSFLSETNLSIVPRLTRTATFIKNDEEKKTPQSTRKSTRKRWSQVERTPIFNTMPKWDSPTAADQSTETTLEGSIYKSNSFMIKTPPALSPTKSWNNSLKTKPSEAKRVGKEKKSVKIETPAKTPKIRPLITRKTPGPELNVSDNSNMSGSCVATAAYQSTETTPENTISKSITIKTALAFSPTRRKNNLLKTTPSEAKRAEKEKKSVKIEAPVKTPKIRLHSPLIMRKLPGDVSDSSILSGNYVGRHSPQKTSTPYPKKKDVSLLQKVLTSEKNKFERSLSLKNISKNSVRAKMPDFAKIHQRQYEKMENLKEMQERKAVRAQYLLSGSKPLNISAPKINGEARKQLNFSPKKGEPSKCASNTSTSKASTSKPLSKPLQHMRNKRASLDKKKKEFKSKVPVAITKHAVIATAKPEPKALTRFGFKLPPGKENVTKDEQIKAAITKSKITVNRTETNRKQLGSVRSNRRFDLLMKMRESKK